MKKKKESYIYRLSNQKVSSTYSGKKTSVTYRIPSIDEVYDNSTNKNRLIRYVLGESSVYADEQTTKNPVLADVIFVNGILTVQADQANLIAFMENTNYNNSNKNRRDGSLDIFFRVDREIDAQKMVEQEVNSVEANYVASTMDPQKLVAYARVLGINVDRSMYEIKWDMMNYAKSDPDGFLSGIDDIRTERKQTMFDAQDYNIIDFSHAPNEVNWILGNQRPTILHIPVGMNKMDYFVEWTLDPEGESVYKEVLDKIRKMISMNDVKEDLVMENEMVEVEINEESPKPKKKMKTSKKK